MKSLLVVFVVGSILTFAVGAQDAPQAALRKGVRVQMPVADHAAEMRAADEPNSPVVAITATGRVFAGVEPTEPAALGKLSARTVYVKADAQAPFQTFLTVLDALRGKSVVLLTAVPTNVARGKIVSPYGIKLVVSR